MGLLSFGNYLSQRIVIQRVGWLMEQSILNRRKRPLKVRKK